MKSFSWILAGIGIGAFIAYIVMNTPEPQYSTGSSDVEDAALRTSAWGGKQRVTGTGGNLVGKVKGGVGNLTGNDDLAGEGVVDQAVGAVKDTVGELGQAAGKTLHDLNR